MASALRHRTDVAEKDSQQTTGIQGNQRDLHFDFNGDQQPLESNELFRDMVDVRSCGDVAACCSISGRVAACFLMRSATPRV